MTVEEVISKMNEKIEEVKKAAEAKRPLISEEDRVKLDEIVGKMMSVVNEASHKVSETVSGLNADEKSVSEFLDRVYNKCSEACDFTVKKIQGFANDPEAENRLNEATKCIGDSFDSLMENEDVKNVLNQLKNAGENVRQTLNDVWNKAETQEEVRRVKKGTLDIATKAYNALAKLLSEEEEKVEEVHEEIHEEVHEEHHDEYQG